VTTDEELAYTDDLRWGEDEPGPQDAVLERAWAALDAGQPDQALTELGALDPDWPERWIPEALARTELGDLRTARTVLDQARGMDELEDHPDYLWACAQLLLREWKIDAARATYERLLAIERGAAVLERLSLCAEFAGDFDAADRLLAEAAELDPKLPAPPRLSESEFESVVSEAIESLPAEFARSLETCEIVIEAIPSAWMIDERDAGETPPDMLGLFVGASQLEAGEYDSGLLPPRIFLFQRNVERACRDHDELVREIRITLFHEIGHMLGFDEEGVAALGLE
jgi:predicted Zn-dependent protease with MMP-like domain